MRKKQKEREREEKEGKKISFKEMRIDMQVSNGLIGGHIVIGSRKRKRE